MSFYLSCGSELARQGISLITYLLASYRYEDQTISSLYRALHWYGVARIVVEDFPQSGIFPAD